MKTSFYIGMALGTVGTAFVLKKEQFSKMMAKARRK